MSVEEAAAIKADPDEQRDIIQAIMKERYKSSAGGDARDRKLLLMSYDLKYAMEMCREDDDLEHESTHQIKERLRVLRKFVKPKVTNSDGAPVQHALHIRCAEPDLTVIHAKSRPYKQNGVSMRENNSAPARPFH